MAWGLSGGSAQIFPFVTQKPAGGRSESGTTIWEAIRRTQEARAQGKTTQQIIREEAQRATESYLFNKARRAMEITKKTTSTPTTTSSIVGDNKKYLILGAIAIGAFFFLK